MIDMQKGIYMSTTDFVRFLSVVKTQNKKENNALQLIEIDDNIACWIYPSTSNSNWLVFEFSIFYKRHDLNNMISITWCE